MSQGGKPKIDWGNPTSRYAIYLSQRKLVPLAARITQETANRLDAIWKMRGLNKRTDCFKEAIAEYLAKYEKAATVYIEKAAAAISPQ